MAEYAIIQPKYSQSNTVVPLDGRDGWPAQQGDGVARGAKVTKEGKVAKYG